MDRLTIVSCDCHAAATPAEYREYLEAELHERYDALQAKPEALRHRSAQIIGPCPPKDPRTPAAEVEWPLSLAFRSKGRRPR